MFILLLFLGCIKELKNEFVYKGKGDLVKAAKQGRKNDIINLLAKSEDINEKDPFEKTPLLAASENGHKEIVELLLASGATVDLAMNDGKTSLFIASQQGHKEVVELLVTNGASIDAFAGIDANTPLYIASQLGHKEVVELLLAKGAKIDLAMNDGRTALYTASAYDRKEVVELLLAKGAKIYLAMNIGATPLMIASWCGCEEVVELLLSKGANVDLAQIDRATPLKVASLQGHKEVVELLLANRAAIDLSDINGCTPLKAASENGHKEVVELLLANGAAIDLANKNGYTPLYVASKNGHKEIVELLLINGASIELGNKDEETPLFIASKNGHKEVVELLLTKGASIELANKYGETPLYIASDRERKEVVELLLSKGAEINLASRYECTPLQTASKKGHKEIVELLLAKGANIDLAINGGATPLIIASANGNKEIVEILLANRANVDLVQNVGATSLYIASQNGHKEVVELLLANGANVDLAMNDGATPLYAASEKGHNEIVELLLTKGAKIKGFGFFFPHKEIDFFNNIISYTLEINNTSSLFSGEFLLKEKNIDLYVKLSNALPFSFMIDNFFDIPSRNYYGYNCFHLAVMQDSTDSLKKLLSNRDIFHFVNSIDNKEKETCLALAHRLDKMDHIKALLSFEVSPIYVKYGFFTNKNINILDIPNMREYVANKVIFQAIKEGRIENAVGLLNVLSNEDNEFSYKRIINLAALDDEGNNVFHALAIYTNSTNTISSDNKMNVEHFLNRCLAKLENDSYEIPSFSEELIFAYNNLGQTPFHCAILNSNEDFVEYFLTNEKIKREDVTKLTKDGKSIFELIESNPVSKEVITVLIKHLWSNDEIESFYKSAKVSEEDKEIYKVIKEDRGDLIKDLKIKEEDIMRMINLSVKLNASNCLKELTTLTTKEKAEENALSRRAKNGASS